MSSSSSSACSAAARSTASASAQASTSAPRRFVTAMAGSRAPWVGGTQSIAHLANAVDPLLRRHSEVDEVSTGPCHLALGMQPIGVVTGLVRAEQFDQQPL